MKLNLFLKDEAALLALGGEMAGHCKVGSVIYLQGQLGAGKTTLVRGFLQALGHQGIVKSPTYTIVESYHLQGKEIFHLDLYRVRDPQELEYLGIWEQAGQAIFLIEWPELGGNFLPPADVVGEILIENQGRKMHFEAISAEGENLLGQLSVAAS